MAVPDGANTDNTDNTDQRDPGTPEDQVNQEITSTEVNEWWRSLFGFGDPSPHQAGGGGQGGQFMFANLEDLDAIIGQWEDEREAILADRQAIADAYRTISEPAGDVMSMLQAGASRDSLANLWQHSDAMLKYADNFIAKLHASRRQIAAGEDGAREQIRSVEV